VCVCVCVCVCVRVCVCVWTQGGETLIFHAHADEGGVGSSLFGGHAYSKCGSKVCLLFFFYFLGGWVLSLLGGGGV